MDIKIDLGGQVSFLGNEPIPYPLVSLGHPAARCLFNFNNRITRYLAVTLINI